MPEPGAARETGDLLGHPVECLQGHTSSRTILMKPDDLSNLPS
jgi:hypothetical protein